MGGRGSYSYSGNSGATAKASLGKFAVASLNSGTASGTTVASAVNRFREQTMDAKVEYSAYVDDSGYVHALASVGKEGSTGVAPISALAHETGISTVIHNHPHGTSDGRKWGGPFSEGDMSYIAAAHVASNGKVNRIIATSNEGTYSARVTKTVTKANVRSAAAKADASVSGKKYQSEIAMWRAVNNAYTSEFAKIGIEITFTPAKKVSSKFVTQKIGNY